MKIIQKGVYSIFGPGKLLQVRGVRTERDGTIHVYSYIPRPNRNPHSSNECHAIYCPAFCGGKAYKKAKRIRSRWFAERKKGGR